MLTSFYATKLETGQVFDSQGLRIVVTRLEVKPMTVTQVKSKDKDGYWALQCAVGQKASNKNLNRPQKHHLKGAKLKQAPLFLRELKTTAKPELKPGDQLKITQVFQPGDQVKVTAHTIGRGFTGVIKRWGFSTGPRTHGQSDRWRSPGSIGQRSDPGRVWKGKKMAGHSGNSLKTIRGLQVVAIDEDKNILTLAGTVPGHRRTLVKITKTSSSPKTNLTHQS